ncbi:hypothetical protein BH11VER1_BH11VER1_08610 [soil metagenome]
MKFPLVTRQQMDRKIAALKEKLEKANGLNEKSKAKIKEMAKAAKISCYSDVLRQIKGLSDRRLFIANCLQGEGIEIGALHHPLPVPSGVKVRYVDYKTREQNIRNHPELDASKIVETDYVCNGEHLEIIPDETQDFVIANHMVEHCINPLGTIRQFLRVLKPGGLLFISLPDKRYTFDVLRPVTPFSNPAEDYKTDRKVEPLEMYTEFCEWVQEKDGSEAFANQENIHFHAWTQGEILELFIEARRTFKMPLEIELAARNGIELIILLRKETPESYDRAGVVSRVRSQKHESAGVN